LPERFLDGESGSKIVACPPEAGGVVMERVPDFWVLMRRPYWQKDPWYLTHVIATWAAASDQARERGDIEFADMVITVCFNQNPGLNSYLTDAFPKRPDGTFLYPTEPVTRELLLVEPPKRIWVSRPHWDRGDPAVTTVELNPQPLKTAEHYLQVGAIARVALDVIFTFANMVVIQPVDIKQGFVRNMVVGRALRRGIPNPERHLRASVMVETANARACAILGMERMMHFYGRPRRKLVGLLTRAVTRIELTPSELKAIAKNAHARHAAKSI
jgi:hypothetical protein